MNFLFLLTSILRNEALVYLFMENFDHSKEILNILQINEAFIFYILHNIKEMIFMTFLILLNNFYIRKFFNEIIKFSNIYIIIIFLNVPSKRIIL